MCNERKWNQGKHVFLCKKGNIFENLLQLILLTQIYIIFIRMSMKYKCFLHIWLLKMRFFHWFNLIPIQKSNRSQSFPLFTKPQCSFASANESNNKMRHCGYPFETFLSTKFGNTYLISSLHGFEINRNRSLAE